MEWADYEFAEPASGYTSADNGALQVHMLKTLLPNNHIEIDTCNRLWYSSSDFDTYMRYVTCCKVGLPTRWTRSSVILLGVIGRAASLATVGVDLQTRAWLGARQSYHQ
jgi:hypothetical protein